MRISTHRPRLVVARIWLLALALAAGCRTRPIDDRAPSGAVTDLAPGGEDGPIPACRIPAFPSWGMERGTAHHRARSWQVGPASGDVKWTYDTGLSTASVATPIIGGNFIVYLAIATNTSAELHAILGETGKLLWKFRGAPGSNRASTPAIGLGTDVFVGLGDTIYALDALGGAERWRTPGNGTVTLAPDGTVYAGNQALDGDTGQPRWTVKLDNSLVGAPAIGDDCTVYYASGSLYAVDPATGNVKWRAAGRDQNPSWSTPAISDANILYYGGGDRVLYALDATSGDVRWQRPTDRQIMTSQAIDSSGTVFFSHGNNDVLALDGTTGMEKWTFRAGNPKSSPVVDCCGRVYFGSSGGLLYSVDAATGKEQWSAQLFTKSETSPALGDDGTLYVVGGKGRVQLIAIGH